MTSQKAENIDDGRDVSPSMGKSSGALKQLGQILKQRGFDQLMRCTKMRRDAKIINSNV